jgi:hypothetical protein
MKKIILTLALLISCNVSAIENESFHLYFNLEKSLSIKKNYKKIYQVDVYRNKMDGECYALFSHDYRGGFSLIKCSSFGLISPEQFLEENK